MVYCFDQIVKSDLTKTTLFSVLIFSIILSVFYQSYSFDFINFDDPHYVYENQRVLEGLTKDNIIWAFTNTESGHWQPLTWLSHQLDVSIFGVNAGGMHFVNVVLHGLNCVIIFLLFTSIKNLNKHNNLFLFVSLFFGLHALRLESVIWISERKDVLSILFFLLSTLSYIKFANTNNKSVYCFSLLMLLFSLLTKPTAITAPILFLLLDFWPLGRIDLASYFSKANFKLLYEKIPFLLLSILFSIIAIFAQETAGGLKSINSISITDRVLNSSYNVYLFLEKIFIPQGLAIFYPHKLYDYRISITAFIFILIFSAIILLQAKKIPSLFFAWCWLLIACLPVIGLVQIGGQSIADRWTYLPHIGFLIGLFYFINERLKNHIRLKLSLAICLLVLALLWNNHEIKHWQNSETIYLRAIAVTEDNFMAHNNIGVYYDKLGDFQKAEEHFQKAIKFAPNYPEALNNLGSIRARQSNWLEARDLFKKALSVNPNHKRANYHLQLLYSMNPHLSN